MKMHSLFPGTLVVIVLFCSSAEMARGQVKPLRELTVGAEIASLKYEAEEGNPEAAYKLGFRYLRGRGVSPDFNEAARWFKLAAAAGSADGEFSLGFLYEQGKGVSRDD